MALHFNTGTNYRVYTTLEKLIRSKHIAEVNNREDLEKELFRENNIYCCIDPYDAEIGETIVLMWNKNKEELERLEALYSDEI